MSKIAFLEQKRGYFTDRPTRATRTGAFCTQKAHLKARKLQGYKEYQECLSILDTLIHGLRSPREEIAFTARPKIQSQSQIFRCGQSIFCLPHRPNFSDFFDLCLHWVSIVCDAMQALPGLCLITALLP